MKLPNRTVALYSLGEFGVNAVETLLRVYILVYYTTVLELNAALAGLALGFSLVIDAVSDPLVAHLSDSRRAQGGSTRKIMQLGVILTGISLYFLLNPPKSLLMSQYPLFIFLLIISSLLSVGLTFFAIPYGSLPNVVSTESDVRTRFFASRFGVGNLGAIFIVAGPGQALSQKEAPVEILSLVIVTLVALSCSLATWPKYPEQASLPQNGVKDQSLRQIASSFLEIFQNRSLLFLFGLYFIATIGIAMNSTLSLYYYRYRLFLTEPQIRMILVFFLLSITASLPLWWRLSKSQSAIGTLRLSWLALTLVTIFSYPFYSQGQFWVPFFIGSIFLGFLVGSVILLETLLAQLINIEEIVTRKQKSAKVFALWKFVAKSARALGLSLLGFFLNAIGFDKSTATFESSFPIAILFGPGVGFFLLVSCIGLWFFPTPYQKLVQAERILLKFQIKQTENRST